MTGLYFAIALFAAIVLIGGAFVRNATAKACPSCHYPKRKCECVTDCINAGPHAFGRWRWSQDGWVRKCKLCSTIQYGGDDYDGGPDNDGRMVQD